MKTPPTRFLDFDGVLHPNFAGAAGHFARAPLLSAELASFDCHIAISSSWRFHFPLDEILRRLPEGIGRRVVGRTGEPFVGLGARYREITAWASRHGVRDWRALDDAHFEFTEECAELIGCAGDTGLGARLIALLTTWLAGGTAAARRRPVVWASATRRLNPMAASRYSR